MTEKDFMQEELVSEELEIEINKEIIKLHTAPCYDELKAFALHFVNWQKQKYDQDESDMAVIAYMDGVEKGKQMMKEQMMKDAVEASENLEEAANKYIRGRYSPWLYKSMFDCFKAGAQWLKNKIIKEN